MTNPFNLEPESGEKIWITGDTVIIRATAAETGGAYTMIEAIASPGNGPPTHIHKNEDETKYRSRAMEESLHQNATTIIPS